ncbi:Prodigiosin synthesizing transferase PigC [Candidatus Entotheonellaceae bacterium PAL068K]
MELVWLHDSTCYDPALVGGKVVNLSRLAKMHAVPPGFCLTTAAYARWAVDPDHSRAPNLSRLLATAYDVLAGSCQVDSLRVAVRSSAVDEDGQTASFAGQYESYLNVMGQEAVLEAVSRCWASAQSARVQAYRSQQDRPHGHLPLAVLVQQLVMADLSAVVFSANPVTGDRNEIVINTNWGLGESIVSGRVTPDTYVMRKSDRSIKTRQIADKERMTVLAPNGTRDVALLRTMRHQPTITDGQAIEMAQLALTLERTMGWPVDIECAYQAEKLYVLQCRPITTPMHHATRASLQAPS